MDPLREARRSIAEWFGPRRDRLSLWLIAAVALGGIVCMCAAVGAIIAGRN